MMGMILRKAEIVRNTNETKINLNINLDSPDQNNLSTGLPFFDHMLHQFLRPWSHWSESKCYWRS